MEYLIVSSGLDGADSRFAETIFADNTIGARYDVIRFQGHGFAVYARGDSATFADGVIFDGYVFDDRMYHCRLRGPDRARSEAILGRRRNASGCFTLGLFDRDGFRIATDVLGQSGLWHYSEGGEFAVSNSPVVLGLVTASRRTQIHLANMACYLVAHIDGDIYESNSLINSRNHLEYRDGTFREVSDFTRRDIYLPDTSYEETIADVARQVAHNSSLLADFTRDFSLHTVVDISGGFDSRMCLSGFVGAGRQRDVTFCNANTPTLQPGQQKNGGRSTDRIVSDLLFDEFDLRAGAGLGSTTYDTATLNSHLQFDSVARNAYGVGHYFGMIASAHADYGELYVDGFMRVGGYVGEYTRNIGPNFGQLIRAEADPTEYADMHIEALTRDFHQLISGYTTPGAVELVNDELTSYYEELAGEIPPHLYNLAAYTETRSRCHFGARSQNANRSSVSCTNLCVPQIVSLHQHLKYAEIFHNRIAYDLMTELAGPTMTELPFADKHWTRTIVGDRVDEFKDRTVYEPDDKVSPKALDPIVLPKSGEKAPVPEVHRWLSDNGHPETDRLGAIRFALANNDESTWEVFDKDAVQTYVDETESPGGYRNVRLSAALLFAGEQDQRFTLGDSVDIHDELERAGS